MGQTNTIFDIVGIAALVAVTVIFPSSASACQFDTDCSVGSKCVKEGYNLNGVCVGGLNPGNANDRRPTYDSLDLNRGSRKRGSTGDARTGRDRDGTYGDTCSFDVDCGPGSKCVKGDYALNGTCL